MLLVNRQNNRQPKQPRDAFGRSTDPIVHTYVLYVLVTEVLRFLYVACPLARLLSTIAGLKTDIGLDLSGRTDDTNKRWYYDVLVPGVSCSKDTTAIR